MIAQIINTLYTAFVVLLFARIILSWVRVSPYDQTWGPIVQFVYQITEPLLAPIRNILPSAGGLDFSPIILFFAARIIRDILLSIV
ncbi:MAG: YggT family protein [Chloroflexota bacterium]